MNEAMINTVSLVGSAFSTALTVFFWFSRAQRERPNLKAYLIERNFYIGLQRDLRYLRAELTLIVANHSVLPNAVIGAKVWVRLKNGSLKEFEHLQFDPSTPQPFNIGSLQTVKLKLNGALGFACTEELENGGVFAYLNHYCTNPRELEIQLISLDERRDEFNFKYAVDRV